MVCACVQLPASVGAGSRFALFFVHRLLPARARAVRLHQLRQLGRFLPRTAGPDALPRMPENNATIRRRFKRSEQKRVPVQGRCAVAARSAVLRSSGTEAPVQDTTSRRHRPLLTRRAPRCHRPRLTRPPRKGMPGRCIANSALVGYASIATETRSLLRALIRGIIRSQLVLPLRKIAAGL